MKKKKNQWKYKEWISGYLFLLPALIFFLGFVVYPMIKGIYLSFFDYTATQYRFIGLENYRILFHDSIFKKSLWNTIIIVICTVPLVVVFSLFISIIIYNKSSFTRSFYRAAFYLPTISSIVTISVIWSWIYHPTYGILNYLTSLFGIKPISWLGHEKFALPALILVIFTTAVGQPIILYIAALGNVPRAYKEAAAIDGATRWQQFKHITWPLIMPTSLYIIIITTINSFQTFGVVQLLSGGGPMYRTSTVLFQLYQTAFQFQNFGIASAMGIILAIIAIFISILQFKYFSSDVEY
ncbi:MAG: sugar ABC transporter permease [Epulopiscium sp.]|nr:sugar ABC transporter permease [Candidatus Epulonipiscium sp.]